MALNFSSREQITRGSVKITDVGLLISVNWSKTRQSHEVTHQLSLCYCSNTLICPVLAYKHLITLIPGTGSALDPIFALPNGSNLSPISKHVLLKRFNKLLVLIVLDPCLYSFHSLRHGGATLAAKAGVSEVLLKQHGDWQTAIRIILNRLVLICIMLRLL
ncbi:hypothetical protein SNE40_017174 [Patella caerulea]|uniref:Tyr recombinase domain-containing protein n=1 Tax=Patella caerulea TaxID=87958 RepID=A0AAN8PDK0_PATCE